MQEPQKVARRENGHDHGQGPVDEAVVGVVGPKAASDVASITALGGP